MLIKLYSIYAIMGQSQFIVILAFKLFTVVFTVLYLF